LSHFDEAFNFLGIYDLTHRKMQNWG